MKNIEQGEIERNGRGSPIVGGVTYPRVTTLTGRGEDKSGLMNYSLELGVKGVYDSPDLQAAYAMLRKGDWKAKRQFMDDVKRRARSDEKATIGTAIHEATDRLDSGEDISGLPKVIRDDALAYRATVDRLGLVPEVAELFVVNEEIGAAGTLDRLFAGSKGLIVGDLKTSANPESAKWALSSWASQISVYANSRPVVDGAIVDWSDIGLAAPSLETAVVIHVVQGEAIGKAYRVDLVEGYERAKASAFLYQQDKIFRKMDKTPL